jgi:hypothetical protein
MSVEISSATESGTWTKTITTAATPGETTELGTIELCENSIVGETSFRITGDGFDNTLFNVVSNKNMNGTNMGLYYPGENITLAAIDDLGDEILIYIWFTGNTTGVRDPSEQMLVTITRTTEESTVYYWGGYDEANSDINLNITRYDDVGGVIEGTFSGNFLVQDINKQFTGAQVTITDGKFSVIRYPDAF